MTALCPATKSASSTVDTLLAALLARSTAIGLPGPESAETPATTVAELLAASSSATGTSSWSTGSALPSDGAACGVTITTSVAGTEGCPLMVRNPSFAYAPSMVAALVSCWLPADGLLPGRAPDCWPAGDSEVRV